MENDNDVIEVVNTKTNETKYISRRDLNDPQKYVVYNDKDGVMYVLKRQEYDNMKKEYDQMRGCMLICLFIMTGMLLGGFVWLGIKTYEREHRHPNTISYINDQDKKIIISDSKTNEERMIDYSEMQTFQNKVKYSKVGDPVKFSSPDYKARRVFKLDPKAECQHYLYLNTDSITARINAEKLKNDKDSIVILKNQRQK